MKTIALLFLMTGLLIDSKTEVGLGIVEVSINPTVEIKVFKTKGDKQPEKVIRLIKENGDIVISEKDYIKWLLPEAIKLDYSLFLFRCTQLQGDWIEVVINKDTGEKKWILKTSTLTFHSWEEFLVKNTTAIEPLVPVDIKVEPTSGSKTLRKTSDKDCFEAMEIKGDWIKVKTNETLECNEHPQPIKAGWIRWRQNNQLTIQYFLMC